MRSSTLTKLVFFFLPVLCLAAEEFTVYHPKYLSTEELVSTASSVFAGKATFSSLGGKVVINAPPKVTESVLKLFGELDKRARQYRISFRLVARADGARNSISFKDGQVSVGKNISVNGTLSADSTQGKSHTDSVQSAQLMEGAETQMTLGDSWFPGGFTAEARGGTGDLVTVEFRQRESDANPALSLRGEVLLTLGEWKTVGEVKQSSSDSERGLVSRSGKRSSVKKDLQVKLELPK